jgi:hypothetical protein
MVINNGKKDPELIRSLKYNQQCNCKFAYFELTLPDAAETSSELFAIYFETFVISPDSIIYLSSESDQ